MEEVMSKNNKFGSTTEFRIKQQKKKKLAGWQVALIVIAAAICFLFVTALGVFTYFKYIHKPDNTPDDLYHEVIIPGDNTDEEEEPGLTLNKSRYNFLVLGCDRAQWLSDVIMVVTYDVAEKSVAIMQIPRDTYVTVNKNIILDDEGRLSHENFDGENDYGCKINAVLSHGGNLAERELNRIVNLVANTVDETEIQIICDESFLDITSSQLLDYINEKNSSKKWQKKYDIKLEFGIKYLSALLSRSFCTPIDYYAHVNLDGFVNIVNAIGGVDVYVQEDMYYWDPLQDLLIDIPKGQQHLDGKKAEQFIRFRAGYAAADIARIDAQKIFMTAFIKKLLSLDGIMNIDTLVKEVSENLTTNISVSDALYFATNILDIDFSKIVMLTMPGKSTYIDGISYYGIHKASLMEYVNTYLSKFNEPIGEEYFYAVEVAKGNDSPPPLTAEDITENQPDLGFMH